MTCQLHFRDVTDHLSPSDRDIASKVVFSSPKVRVVNLALAEGALLAEHSTPHPILVQVLTGDVEFTCEGEVFRMGPGGLISVDADIVHAVRAHAPSSVLLTLLL